MAARKPLTPKRGEIYLTKFDPAEGVEIKKTRPALILQNDISNLHSPLTIVAGISSQFGDPIYPTEVLIKKPEGGIKIDSVVVLNQIRSVDKRRLIHYVGKLNSETMYQVDEALKISLSLIGI